MKSMLGDGSCDSACNNAECSFDGGDCNSQTCSDGCSISQIGDKVCQIDCYTSSCGYDGGDCDSSEVCKLDCIELQGNGVCDSNCNTEICDWDGGDCLCSPGCTVEMLSNEPSSCDTNNPCNTKLCNWHASKCNNCSPSCPNELLGNDACNTECQTETCAYDQDDCRGCSPGCNSTLQNGCNKLCFTLDCAYGQLQGGGNGNSVKCSDSLIGFYKYTQSVKQDWSYTDSESDCAATGCTVSTLLSSTNCESKCNNSSCAYSMGRCYRNKCHANCEKCYGSENGECFTCKQDMYQLYGSCLSSGCPLAYITSDQNPYICISDDSTTEITPKKFFVSSFADIDRGGSRGSPSNSIENVLVLCNYKYNEVLLGTGTHQLERYIMSSTTSYITDSLRPLYKPSFNIASITIKPWICNGEESNNEDCLVDLSDSSKLPTINLKNAVTLDVMKNSKLIIENVNIKGEMTLYEGCSLDYGYCYYCPSIITFEEKIYDEHGNQINGLPSDCFNYHDYDVFEIFEGGMLKLSDVVLENIRFEPNSIIYSSTKATIEMNNVDFKNIRVKDGSGGVIYFESCPDEYSPYYCGTITYTSGKVSYLNNGYEISNTQKHAGFISGDGIYSISIANIVFEYNVINNSFDQQPLFLIKNYRTISLTDCTFNYNIFTGGIIEISGIVSIDDTKIEDGKIRDHNIQHLTLTKITISHSYSYKSLLFNLNLAADVHNIKASEITAYNSIMNGFMQITGTKLYDVDSTGGSKKVTINGRDYQYNINSKALTIETLTVSDCNLGGGGLLIIKYYPNISIDTLLLDNSNVDDSFTIKAMIATYISAGSESYIENGVSLEDPVREYLSSISEFYTFTMVKSSIKNVSQDESAIVMYISYTKTSASVTITDSIFESITAMDSNSGAVFQIDLNSQVNFRGLTFEYITSSSSSGYGPVHITGGSSSSLNISSSSFLANTAGYAAGIYMKGLKNITLASLTFRSNSASSGNGGSIYYLISENTDSTLDLSDCEFTENRAKKYGGAISIESPSLTDGILYLKITSSDFSENSSDIGGSVIYISEGVSLTSTSYVNDCQFEENTSVRGLGYFSFDDGILQFNRCSFEKNTSGSTAVFYSTTGYSDGEEAAYVKVKDCTFEDNEGISVIYLSGSSVPAVFHSEDCEFMNNNAVVVMGEASDLYDTGSKFHGNQAQQAPAIKISSLSEATLSNTEIYENISTTFGGAIKLSESSTLTCNSCIIRDNSSEDNGGAIFIEQSSTIILLFSSIYGNTSKGSGSALYFLGSHSRSIIKDSKLYSNHAEGSGTISMYDSSLSIESTEFYSNTSEESPGIVMNDSDLDMKDSKMYDQHSQLSAFIYSPIGSNISIENSAFSSSSSQANGGGFYLGRSIIELKSSEFHDVSGLSGGLIYLYDISNLKISDSNFENLLSDSTGFLYALESSIEIEDSTISNIRNGAIYGEGLSNLSLSNIEMKSCEAFYIYGNIYCEECASVSIDRSTFDGNTSLLGGALHLVGNRSVGDYYTISNSKFYDNIARTGGAIYLTYLNAKIQSCEFLKNSAISGTMYMYEGLGGVSDAMLVFKGMGGAVFIDCVEFKCDMVVEDTTFSQNSAAFEGGAMKWTSYNPTESNNLYSSNTAPYGGDKASYPYQLTYETLDSSRRLTTMDNIVSGQKIDIVFNFYLKDEYGQVITTDDSSTCKVSIDSDDPETYVGGVTEVTAIQGVYTFDNIIIYAEPLTSVTFSAISSAMKYEAGEGEPVELDLDLNMRDCIEGEEKSSNACTECQEGTYNQAAGEICKECIDNSVCFGGSLVVPEAGYWRSGKYSDTTFECPFEDACLGGVETKNPIGDCDTGYKGNLCQSCEDDYSRSNDNECAKCPDQQENIGILVSLVIVTLIVIGILVRSSIKSAYIEKSIFSVYFKILLNYLQLMSIMSTFNLNWPGLVIGLFYVQNQATNSTDHLFSVDCFVDTVNEPVFVKLTILALLPVLFSIFLLALWVFGFLITCIKRDRIDKVGSKFLGSITVTFFLIHPQVLRGMYSAFNCREIEDGEYWLIANLDIRCWEGDHLLYSLAVALPGLLIWGLMTPALCLIFLSRKRRDLNSLHQKLRFGFIYHGFRDETFYWEFVILYRKAILIGLSVFLSNYSITAQALTVFLILAFYLYIHRRKMPYSTDDLNNLETYSILVSLVTIYAGLYYLTNDLGIQGEIILFIIILIFNILFIQLWIRKTLIMMLNILIEKFPKLKTKLQGTCIEKYILNTSVNLKSKNRQSGKSNTDDKSMKDNIDIYEEDINTSTRKKVKSASSEENEGAQLDLEVHSSSSRDANGYDAIPQPHLDPVYFQLIFKSI